MCFHKVEKLLKFIIVFFQTSVLKMDTNNKDQDAMETSCEKEMKHMSTSSASGSSSVAPTSVNEPQPCSSKQVLIDLLVATSNYIGITYLLIIICVKLIWCQH